MKDYNEMLSSFRSATVNFLSNINTSTYHHTEGITSAATVDFFRKKKVEFLLHSPLNPHSNGVNLLLQTVRQIQLNALDLLGQSFIQSGVEAVAFKGVELAYNYAMKHSLGIMSDVDVLVNRKDLFKVKRILTELGFVQGRFKPELQEVEYADLLEVAQAEVRHYELWAFIKKEILPVDDELACQYAREYARHPLWYLDNKIYFILQFDIHFKLAEDLELEIHPKNPLLETGRMNGFYTLTPSFHVWYLTAKFYTEVAQGGKTSLRDFVYIMLLINCGRIDWQIVSKLAIERDLRPSVFYFLGFLNRMFGLNLPQDFFITVNPIEGSRKRDWGWQTGKLFDLIDPSLI